MNLKEEILNVTETGVSPSTGVTFPWVRPWDAEDIAIEYAKEKDDEIQALKVRIEELEFELKRAEEHIDGMKSING